MITSQASEDGGPSHSDPLKSKNGDRSIASKSGGYRSCFSDNLFNQQLTCPLDSSWSAFAPCCPRTQGQDRSLIDRHLSPFKRVTILDRLTGKEPHRIDAGGRIPCRAEFGTGQHKRIAVAGIEL